LQENLQRHNGWRRQICVREGNVHSGHRGGWRWPSRGCKLC
jgi:hypothetical protein